MNTNNTTTQKSESTNSSKDSIIIESDIMDKIESNFPEDLHERHRENVRMKYLNKKNNL